MRRSLRAVRTMLGLAFRADPRRAAAAFALSGLTAVLLTLTPLWLKVLADSVVAGRVRGVVLAAAGAALSAGLATLAAWHGFSIRTVLVERTSMALDERLVALIGGMPGLEHHERPEHADNLEILREEREALVQTLSALVSNVAVAVRSLITLVLLGSVHPLLVLLPAFAVPPVLAGAGAARMRQRAQEAAAGSQRLAEHLFDLSTSAGPGKELRVFGLQEEVLARHRLLWDRADRARSRAGTRAAAVAAAAWLTFAAAYAAAVLLVAWLAVRGRATPGDVLMAVALATQLNRQVETAVLTLGWLFRTLRGVERYLWLEDYAAGAADGSVQAEPAGSPAEGVRPVERVVRPAEPVAVPARLRAGIELDEVSFRYPGAASPALSGVTLRLPPGTTVALVGENGAGKTTLVKLLCGFYRPTTGSIRVDGTDLRRFDPWAWRARLAGAFQDAARLELVLREAVGVGDLPRIEDGAAVEAALDRAGAAGLAARLSGGLEAQLGTSFDGADLSAGQWQTVALGRAMMRAEPLLMVLDEPTAVLDAQTEHALFERYARAAVALAERSGGITLLVTHRFSTVRTAGLIVVLDGSRVVETGTHRGLLAAGGLYAELYGIQARAYR